MNADYIRHCLKHVYWLCGGACAGKTTMASMLAERYDFQAIDDDVLRYRPYADPDAYPAMQMPNPSLNWDSWFNRAPEIHGRWILEAATEQLDFLIIDLLRMPRRAPIVVDLGVEASSILPFIDRERIIGLFTDDATIAAQYLFRQDHAMIWERIKKSTADPLGTADNVNRSLIWLSRYLRTSCELHGIHIINRYGSMSKEAQFAEVCAAWGLR